MKRKLLVAAVVLGGIGGAFLAGADWGTHLTDPRRRASRYLDRPEFAPLPQSAHEIVYEATGPGTGRWPLRLLPALGDVDITVSFRAHPKDVERFIASSSCLAGIKASTDDSGALVYDVQITRGPDSGWTITISPDGTRVRIHFFSEFT